MCCEKHPANNLWKETTHYGDVRVRGSGNLLKERAYRQIQEKCQINIGGKLGPDNHPGMLYEVGDRVEYNKDDF